LLSGAELRHELACADGHVLGDVGLAEHDDQPVTVDDGQATESSGAAPPVPAASTDRTRVRVSLRQRPKEKRMPDVVEMIMQDHREVERMFAELKSSPEKRAALVPVLITLLTAHSRAEEAEV
jgi:hypothetical protein